MKKALITGGSKGIGLALTKLFCEQGFSVVSTYNSTSPSWTHPSLRWAKLDLLEVDSFLPFAQEVGSLDVLIHNAGVGTKTVESFSDQKRIQDEIFFRVNTLAPMWLTDNFLPGLRESKSGKIIFVSSVGGGIFHFPRFRSADGMSKAALTFYAKQLAAELSQSSVDVFTICPGATETDMFKASTLNSMTESDRKDFVNSLPKQRLIQPEEIAELALFLASDRSQIMHGAVIDASLGLGARPGLVDR